MKKIVTFCLLLWLFAMPCAAKTETEELYLQQLESSGANDLWNTLPEQTKQRLLELGVTDLEDLGTIVPNTETALSYLWGMLTETAATPMAASAVVIGIVLLCALIDGMKETVGGEHASLFGSVGVLACSAAVITPMLSCLKRVVDAAESADVFITSFVPVYAGVLATSGQWATAASFQSVLLLTAKGMSYLLSNMIVPLLMVAFALGLIGSVSDGRLQLHTVGSFLQKNTAWILGALMTVFIGFLSLQNLTAAATDSFSGRMIRFSVASFVPIVGGSLSEAIGTVKGCLGLLKGTVGAFGVVADVLIVLPPLLECVWWQIWLSIAQMIADLFGIASVGTILKVGGGLMKTLIAVLACLALLMVLAVTVVSGSGGG